jgi:hypothetical protein
MCPNRRRTRRGPTKENVTETRPPLGPRRTVTGFLNPNPISAFPPRRAAARCFPSQKPARIRMQRIPDSNGGGGGAPSTGTGTAADEIAPSSQPRRVPGDDRVAHTEQSSRHEGHVRRTGGGKTFPNRLVALGTVGGACPVRGCAVLRRRPDARPHPLPPRPRTAPDLSLSDD